MAKDEVEALMWAIATGIVLILSVMMAVACLLVRYNRAGYKAYIGEGGRWLGARSVIEEEYMSPRTDVISSRRPHVPVGKRPSTPSSLEHRGSHAPSDEHIYDLPSNYETTSKQVMAASVSRSESSLSSSPTLRSTSRNSE